MQLKTIIKTLLFLGSSTLINAQSKTLYIRPALGLQMPVAKNLYDGFTHGSLAPHRFSALLHYSAGLEYIFNNKRALFAEVSNGLAGYSIGVKSNKPSTNGYNGTISHNFIESTYNEKRVCFGIIFKFKPAAGKESLYIETSFQTGLGIDFRSNENDSASVGYSEGTNNNGEDFFLKDSISTRRAVAFVLPLQLNLQIMSNHHPGLTLSFFVHIGLLEHYKLFLDYVGPSYTDHSLFSIRGTTAGFKLSCPVKIWGMSNR